MLTVSCSTIRLIEWASSVRGYATSVDRSSGVDRQLSFRVALPVIGSLQARL
jgi:hypothetical protein